MSWEDFRLAFCGVGFLMVIMLILFGIADDVAVIRKIIEERDREGRG